MLGQQTIARTQNLGSVKCRLLHLTAEASLAPPAAGSRLLDAAGAAAGIVVRAAAAERGTELLAVIQLEAGHDTLICEKAPNTPLRLAALAYSIPEIAAPRIANVTRSSLRAQHAQSPSGFMWGNSRTSRIEEESVSSITSRSIPMPKPAAGGIPYSRARM